MKSLKFPNLKSRVHRLDLPSHLWDPSIPSPAPSHIPAESPKGEAQTGNTTENPGRLVNERLEWYVVDPKKWSEKRLFYAKKTRKILKT